MILSYTQKNITFLSVCLTGVFLCCYPIIADKIYLALENQIAQSEKSKLNQEQSEEKGTEKEEKIKAKERKEGKLEAIIKVQEQQIGNQRENSQTQIDHLRWEEKQVIWKLEIPIISLTAEIAEGTTDEIMNSYIGHFTDTPTYFGNVCLAAHNRGYPVNYFQDLKNLKQGDEVIYYTEQGIRSYQVEEMKIIEETDVSCLEDTEENTITLITCVENEPNYRRCVIGKEKIIEE